MIRYLGLAILASALVSPVADSQEPENKDEAKWKPLFDGKTLGDWKTALFGGEGEVYVEEGKLILEQGASMTGVTRDKPFPKSNYEVRWEAARLEGNDFFCGFTFPVKESHCSLIAG